MKEFASARLKIDGTLQDLSAGYLTLEEVTPSKLHIRDDRYRWLYVLKGRGEARDDDARVRYELRPGALFFRCPENLHSVVRDPATEWLEFFLSLPASVYRHLCALGVIRPEERFRQPGCGKALQQAARMFYQALQARPSACELYRALLTLLAAAESHAPANHPPLTARVLTMLEEHPQDSIPEIAAQAGISPDYLCRLIRRETGLTPIQHRVRTRLATAQALLRETELSIETIAARLGYPDRFTFSRQFARYLRQPPAAYRRQATASDIRL